MAACGEADKHASLQRLASFLATHAWLADCHTASFFTQRAWERVPAGWLEALAALPAAELHAVPSGVAPPGAPPGLAAFVGECRELSLQRACTPPPPPQPVCACAAAPGLGRMLTEGMPAKKRHEVDALAALVARVAAESRADAVLDVGAGQGYLAQALALRHGLRVLALDAVAPLAAAADARSARMAAAAARCTCRAVVPPRAVAAHFAWEAPEHAAASLQALLRHTLPPELGPKPRIVLVGLHACGDLTPNLCRAFAACEAAAALVVVGCCYNLLTEASGAYACADGSGAERAAAQSVLGSTAAAGGGAVAPAEPPCVDAPPGFPLSAAAAALGLRLGRDARMLACQSGERWATPGGAPSARTTAGHVFRAAMDVVLRRFYPGARKDVLSAGGRGTDHAAAEPFVPALASPVAPEECAAFAHAAHAALLAAGLDAQRAPAAELAAVWRDELAPRSHLLPAFCALRTALAAPLESLIAMDRLLFLRETLGYAALQPADQASTAACSVLPVFDPARSPRNLALVALKARPPDT